MIQISVAVVNFSCSPKNNLCLSRAFLLFCSEDFWLKIRDTERIFQMKKDKFHRIEIEGGNASVTMAAAYLPAIGYKEYALLSDYIDVLNDMAEFNRLDSLAVTAELYGKITDDDLREVERQMKRDWDSLALHQDELLHVGALSSVMDLAWLLGCAFLGVIKPFLLPILLPYMAFNVLQTYRRTKKLLAAGKFKDCACEIANCLNVVRGSDDEIAAKVNPIVDFFESTDGSSQDIYLKLAAKADDVGLEAVERYYNSHFEDNRPRRGMLRSALTFLKVVLKDEDASKMRIPDRATRRAPVLKASEQKRSIEFVVLPTRESHEIYLADEFSDGDTFPLSLMPPALHPIAHLMSESDVEISNVIRAPEALDMEQIRPKISQSLYITAYSSRKFHAMKLGQLVSFEKRQIPIALIAIGVLHMIFGAFTGSYFVSPILLFGAATLVASLLLSRSVKKHFSDIADGFDRIFEHFSRPELVRDDKLSELNELVKDSANPVDAYTETFHRALHFGWNGIADVYQSKAVFHLREFKEPGECIMRVER